MEANRSECRGVHIDLEGALCVVIGASEGIGAAIAVGLAEAGASLVLGGRDPGRMSSTLEAVEATGADVDVIAVDVREPTAVQAFRDDVVGAHGHARVLVNSMGGTLIRPMLEVDVEEWDDLVAIHLRGAFLTCQAFASGMAEQGYGKIVNLSSVSGSIPNRGRGVYSIAKSGVNQLTRVLAAEWGPSGIRVNGIGPATTRTPRAIAQLAREPERERELSKRIPLGRIATPEDMVGAALFFASPLSDFVSGQTLLVDGGATTVR